MKDSIDVATEYINGLHRVCAHGLLGVCRTCLAVLILQQRTGAVARHKALEKKILAKAHERRLSEI